MARGRPKKTVSKYIEINNSYRIRRMDERCVVIEKRMGEGWTNDGYYGKWEHLVKSLLDRLVKDIEGDTLLECLNSLSEQIEKAKKDVLEQLEVVVVDL